MGPGDKDFHLMFVTGYGQYDSHLYDGDDYQTLTFEDIVRIAARPPSVRKNGGQWFIPSRYRDFDARTKKAQLENGRYNLLWADIDSGAHDIASVIDAVRNLIGNAEFLVHSSHSHEPELGHYKWHVLIPLDEQYQMPALAYEAAATVLVQRLRILGLQVGNESRDLARLVFLPNPKRRDCYQWFHQAGPRWRWDQPFSDEAMTLYQESLNRQQRQPVVATMSKADYRGWFNELYPLEVLFAKIGGVSNNGGLDWHFPMQTSQSFATRIWADGGFTTRSETMKNLFRKEWGDSADVFIALDCMGDGNLAQRCFSAIPLGWRMGEDPDRLKGDFARIGKQILDDWMRLRESEDRQAAMEFNEANPLNESTSKLARFASVPEPTGNIKAIADWVYDYLQYDPHRDMAILTAWTLAAAFSGRKDSFEGNPPTMQLTIRAINGFGKNVVLTALNKILADLEQEELEVLAASPSSDNLLKMDECRWRYQCFRQHSKHFGVAAMAKTYLRTLSSLSIIPEAGHQDSSQAGDASSVRSAFLQNVSQEAYMPSSFPELAASIPTSYGVNVSYIRETTPETDAANNGGKIHSGDTARELSFLLDVSKSGLRNDDLDRSRTPKHILAIFRMLIEEALRGEDPKHQVTINKIEYPAPAALPIKHSDRRLFRPTPEAKEFLVWVRNQRHKLRTSNKSNLPSLEWAQAVRYDQQLYRIALIHARTQNIRTDLITLADLKAADALIRSSRQAEMANKDAFESPMDQLIAQMHEYAIDVLLYPPRAYQERHKDHRKDLLERRLKATMFTGLGAVARFFKTASDIAEKGNIARTRAQVIQKAAEEGALMGFWTFEPAPISDKRLSWSISGVMPRD